MSPNTCKPCPRPAHFAGERGNHARVTLPAISGVAFQTQPQSLRNRRHRVYFDTRFRRH
jgi:hypothetical protein